MIKHFLNIEIIHKMQSKRASNIEYDYDYEEDPYKRDTLNQKFQKSRTSKKFFDFENYSLSTKPLSTRAVVIALVIVSTGVLAIGGGLAGLLYWVGRNSKSDFIN